jgi:hypothetical protein
VSKQLPGSHTPTDHLLTMHVWPSNIQTKSPSRSQCHPRVMQHVMPNQEATDVYRHASAQSVYSLDVAFSLVPGVMSAWTTSCIHFSSQCVAVPSFQWCHHRPFSTTFPRSPFVQHLLILNTLFLWLQTTDLDKQGL